MTSNVISNIDNEIKEKNEIVQIANTIKDKYNQLKSIKDEFTQKIEENLQPIVQPLTSIETNLKNVLQKKEKKRKKSAIPSNENYRDETTSTAAATLLQTKNIDDETNKQQISQSPSPVNVTGLPLLNDPYYGLSYDQKTKNFKIGNQDVAVVENHLITADGQAYDLSTGLTYLLTCDQVNLEKNLYTQDDLNNYADIIIRTNSARKSNGAWKNIPKRSEKFNFIKTLIGESSRPSTPQTPRQQQQLPVPSSLIANTYFTPLSTPTPTKQGSGFRKIIKPTKNIKKINTKRKHHSAHLIQKKNNLISNRFMIPNNQKYQIIYYDDPNELVERLKLLYGEQNAGNTSIQISNEIQAILEELKERGIY